MTGSRKIALEHQTDLVSLLSPSSSLSHHQYQEIWIKIPCTSTTPPPPPTTKTVRCCELSFHDRLTATEKTTSALVPTLWEYTTNVVA